MEIHTKELAEGVVYQHPMPNVETLMEQWPENIADLLTSMDLTDSKDLAKQIALCIPKTVVCVGRGL